MNLVVVSGHLGRDVDLRAKPDGSFEGEISLAVKDYIGKGADHQPQYLTTWVTVVVFGSRAKSLQDQLWQGRFVTVKGQLRTKPYKAGDKTVPFTYVAVAAPDHAIEFDPRAARQQPAAGSSGPPP